MDYINHGFRKMCVERGQEIEPSRIEDRSREDSLAYALERNITKIYLETSPCGRALYESAGFSEMRDMMLLTYGK